MLPHPVLGVVASLFLMPLRKPKLSRRLREEAFFRYVINPRPGRCPVYRCTNLSRSDRALCHRHNQERWRAVHPDRAAYADRRHHARHRGLEFTITFEEFMALATDFGWDFFNPPPVSFGACFSVDRKDATLGYIPGNVRGISISANVIKGNRERHSPRYQAYIARLEGMYMDQHTNRCPDDELPF